MQIGIIGLGRMGGNIARRLMRAGHDCAVYDISAQARADLSKDGARPAETLEGLVASLTDGPRALWVMLPAGKITEGTIAHLASCLAPGDIIIDGGNTYYKDDMRRSAELAKTGIQYIDVGTSGGVWGLERGYCLMIGGETDAVTHLDPIFAALAPGRGDIPPTQRATGSDARVEQGYIHAGPAGAGHFVKMIHNGIEYGMMQAYAEGFNILESKNAEALPVNERFALNVADIAEVWRRGSVVTSWLLDLSAAALARDPHLDGFSGYVEDSGEGRWTVEAAIEEAVPAEVLTASLYTRFRSRQTHNFAEKMLSAMRLGFGGHMEKA
ncbi:phosphogluconate dehydrogenase (NAD(+)-dependent, decarboxylating) [Devosia sp.]|uniref:phosphogluconate dehydrogenase (NAD(+)-dependent, decarboxylating) n=1 Tax=Devosia sp. TaxID=1871048 RepID=UPI003BAC750B